MWAPGLFCEAIAAKLPWGGGGIEARGSSGSSVPVYANQLPVPPGSFLRCQPLRFPVSKSPLTTRLAAAPAGKAIAPTASSDTSKANHFTPKRPTATSLASLDCFCGGKPSRLQGRRLALQGDKSLLSQLVDGVGGALAGVAGVLDAAVGLLIGAEGRDLVDQDTAELEGAAGLQAAADVAGEDAGLEAELGVVGALQRLLEVAEGVDRGDRAEDLLAPDLGVFRRRLQQGRGEAAALVDELAAGQQLGPAGDRLVDPLLDAV